LAGIFFFWHTDFMKWPWVSRYRLYQALISTLDAREESRCLRRFLVDMIKENKSLKIQLDKALQNDRRDPVTGQYISIKNKP